MFQGPYIWKVTRAIFLPALLASLLTLAIGLIVVGGIGNISFVYERY